MKQFLIPAAFAALSLAPTAAHAATKIPCGETRISIGAERGGHGIYKYRYLLSFGPGVRDVKLEYGGTPPGDMKFHRTQESMYSSGVGHRVGGEFGEGTSRTMNSGIVNVFYNDPPADKSKAYIYVLCTK